MTRNGITNTTAALTVGIKDHMGHFIMSDENIDKIYEITSKANLIYMSHTIRTQNMRKDWYHLQKDVHYIWHMLQRQDVEHTWEQQKV